MRQILLASVVVQLVCCANIQHGYQARIVCHDLHGYPRWDKCIKDSVARQEKEDQVAEQAEKQWRKDHPVVVAQIEAAESAQFANNMAVVAQGLNMINQANYQNQMLWQQQQQNANLQLLYHQQAMQNAREWAQPFIRPFIDSARR